MSCLRSFLFVVVRRDGSRADAIFYAASPQQAVRYARDWARRLGHLRVELVVEEAAA